jgi:uncharacterized cupin superfamily protein
VANARSMARRRPCSSPDRLPARQRPAITDWDAAGAAYAAKLPGPGRDLRAGASRHAHDADDRLRRPLSGELWLELDGNEERRLAPGDVVIQNGTRHAWRNRGTEPATILSVMIGAEPASP